MSFVYFVREFEGAVKIGVAAFPNERLLNLQIANPRPLQLLIALDCGAHAHEVESGFHELFADQHIRGEWFHWNSELHTLIIGFDKLSKCNPRAFSRLILLLREVGRWRRKNQHAVHLLCSGTDTQKIHQS